MKTKLIVMATFLIMVAGSAVFMSCNSNQQFFGESVFGEIVMYRTVDTFVGDLGSRSGADTQCEADKPSDVSQSHVRAYLSVDASDEVRDMPENYNIPTNLPIVGVNGEKIGDNWEDLLDGSIDATLNDAGFIDDLTVGAWMGSNEDGSVTLETCTGWTNGVAGAGSIAQDDETSPWISPGASVGCNNALASWVLCVAY